MCVDERYELAEILLVEYSEPAVATLGVVVHNSVRGVGRWKDTGNRPVIDRS